MINLLKFMFIMLLIPICTLVGIGVLGLVINFVIPALGLRATALLLGCAVIGVIVRATIKPRMPPDQE